MQSCKEIMQHPVRTGLKGASAGCLCCLCRLQSDNVALDHTVKAEANARAANKKEFLDKMARMSAHVESLKVQRRCHPSTFSIESLFCSRCVWSLVPRAGMHGRRRHAHSAK